MDEISRKINILLNVEKSFLPKAEYIFRLFCKVIGLQPEFFYGYTMEDINVYYGIPVDESYPIEIYHDPATASFFEGNDRYDRQNVHFVRLMDEYIPYLFSETGVLYHHLNYKIKIRKDIIASAFFFITCWEEYVQEHRSKEQEKSATLSTLAQQMGFAEMPVVDRYCEIFLRAIEMVMPGNQRENKLLEDEVFAVSLAHIIDNIYKKDVQNLKANLTMVQNLVSFEKKKGVCSALFLPIPDRSKGAADSIKVYLDSVNNHKDVRRKELKADHTLGIFSNQYVSKSEISRGVEQYSSEKAPVRGYCLTNLKTHYTKLFNELEDTVVTYDISIFNNDTPGFRAGTSLPFYPFNIVENRPFKVLEIPTVGLSHLKDSGRTKPSYLTAILNLLFSISKRSQFFTDIIHHRTLLSIVNIIKEGEQAANQIHYYKKVVSYSSKNQGLQITPDYICDKWLTR